MEELAGTAPASAGLSWLVVYRHSLSMVVFERVLDKQTKSTLSQALKLNTSQELLVVRNQKYGVSLGYLMSSK